MERVCVSWQHSEPLVPVLLQTDRSLHFSHQVIQPFVQMPHYVSTKFPSYFCQCDVGVCEWDTKVPNHTHGQSKSPRQTCVRSGAQRLVVMTKVLCQIPTAMTSTHQGGVHRRFCVGGQIPFSLNQGTYQGRARNRRRRVSSSRLYIQGTWGGSNEFWHLGSSIFICTIDMVLSFVVKMK